MNQQGHGTYTEVVMLCCKVVPQYLNIQTERNCYNLCHSKWSHGRDWKQKPSEYDAGVLPATTQN